MASVFLWKDVLYPGRQRTADGRWFTVTARDTARARANCLKMLGRGLRVPCVLEHQPGAGPVKLSRGDRLADYVKHTFGEIRDARRDAAGVLWLKHEVYDPADARMLVTKRMQVSPLLYPSYSDSRGGEYRGATVGHVAATPTPVQWNQRPFEMSRGRALYLSYTPEADVADEPKDDEKPKKADEPAAAATGIGAVIEALRGIGFNIPDEVVDETGLVIAIKAGGGPDKDPDDGLDLGDEGGGNDVTPPGTEAAPSPPLLMSATDPVFPGLARSARKDLQHRVERLFKTGRVTRPTAQKLGRQLAAVELSFTPKGDLAGCPIEVKVAAYEELPAWTAWSRKGGAGGVELSATREVGAPEELAGKARADRDAEAAAWLTAPLAKK